MLDKKNTEVKLIALIGNGVNLDGDFTAQGSARIDGCVDGNVTVGGTLVVGATGAINGNVTAESAVIGGGILGNVEVTGRIELTNTAKVLGDITTSVIVIDESAIFQGKCNMHQSVPDRQAKSKSAKAMKESKKSAKAALAEALKELQEAENKELQERSAAQADNGKNNSDTAKTGAVQGN